MAPAAVVNAPAAFLGGQLRRAAAATSSLQRCFAGAGAVDEGEDIVEEGAPRGRLVAAAGDVAAAGNTYLIAGAVAVALVGTAFPILFARKDTCPECDGAGFIRKSGKALRANAARKDEAQIVCPNCNGLGKLGQIDK